MLTTLLLSASLTVPTVPAKQDDTLKYTARSGEVRTEFTDEEILAAGYTSYRVPDGFVDDPNLENETVGYISSISIQPLATRKGSRWDLCTDDVSTARRWEFMSDSNSSVHYVLVGESETEKYFEFQRQAHGLRTYNIYQRVHKCSYFDRTGYDERAHRWNRDFQGWFQGSFNAHPITRESVRELCEYLWLVRENRHSSARVMSSFTMLIDNEVQHTLYVLRALYQDNNALSMDELQVKRCEKAEIILTRMVYHVDQESGKVTLDWTDIRSINTIDNPPEVIERK